MPQDTRSEATATASSSPDAEDSPPSQAAASPAAGRRPLAASSEQVTLLPWEIVDEVGLARHGG